MKIFKILVLAILLGAVSGSLASFVIYEIQFNNKEKIIETFYLIENYVHVSPHGLRKHIAKGDSNFVIVDTRSQEEYEKEHIIGAVNIPAYRDPETSAYGEVERIVSMFKSLQEQNPEKEIMVYCYSIPCMTGRKVGKMLAENGIYVQQLGIGWNEWKYYWELWNHEHEWNQTNVEDYIATGPDPGIFKQNLNIETCNIEGEFSC